MREGGESLLSVLDMCFVKYHCGSCEIEIWQNLPQQVYNIGKEIETIVKILFMTKVQRRFVAKRQSLRILTKIIKNRIDIHRKHGVCYMSVNNLLTACLCTGRHLHKPKRENRAPCFQLSEMKADGVLSERLGARTSPEICKLAAES